MLDVFLRRLELGVRKQAALLHCGKALEVVHNGGHFRIREEGNNRNIITIVNKSFVDKDKQTHFQDTKILYNESINNFYMSTILNESTPVYKIINPLTDKRFMAVSSITKFGYKDIKTNIDLNKVSNNNINFSNNFDNELIEIQINDSRNSINYEFLKSNILFKIFSSS